MNLTNNTLNSTYPTNLNLVNFALKVTGPLPEQKLSELLITL